MQKCRQSVLPVVVGLLLVGCGAKTGLDVPDANEDAGTDAGSLDAGIPCVEVPLDGGPIEVPLETEAQLGRADVVFLIDVTASMMDEIEEIRDSLRDQLAPAIEAEIPDASFGVATFADFPMTPYGDAEDHPFELALPMTSDLSRVQAAVNRIGLGSGRDEPESQVEALYQLATGEGLVPYIDPSFGCPMGGRGYPCFRDDALPVVLLFTDAPFHNGPGGANPYGGGLATTPHTYDEAVEALSALGVRVIGFNSGDGGSRDHLRAIAGDTDALRPDGTPLVFDIGRDGDNLNTSVVDAMKGFADGVIFDIDAILQDPTPGDGVDVTEFVESVVPLRAEPPDGVESIDTEAGVFRGVESGTTVVFQLIIRNDAVVPGPEPQRFLLEIIFRGDGRTRLGRRIIEIVIPGADGMGCPDGGTASGL